MLTFILLCAVVVVVMLSVADVRRRRIVAVQRAFDDDPQVAPIVSRTGHLRLAVETRRPLREASGVAEAKTRWVFAAPLHLRTQNAHDVALLLRTPEHVRAFDVFRSEGVAELEIVGATLRAVLTGVLLRNPDVIRQRLLAFVALVDLVDLVDPVAPVVADVVTAVDSLPLRGA